MDESRRGSRRIPVDRSEGFGERLLGQLLDRSHEMPPQLIAPLVAEEVARIGGRDVSIHLQDYEQTTLVPAAGASPRVGRCPSTAHPPARHSSAGAWWRSGRPTGCACICRWSTAPTRSA
ncbi:hypothetical protein [Streptomyces sp. F63]|uniref:hypothetical protein n=1 Tax=Streptomyces sp. F63 TaxID=2824887 RepID=UPI0027DD9B3D|nr:hypothetical protein [Streptomyces sp. F63]